MTEHDRGAYTPQTDAPISFDARQPRGGGGGGRSGLTTLIVSGVILAVLVAAVVVFYRSGVRHNGDAPHLVGTPAGPLKTPAPASATPADEAAGLDVYKAPNAEAASSAPKFAPPPEQPAARPAPGRTPPGQGVKIITGQEPAALPIKPAKTPETPAAPAAQPPTAPHVAAHPTPPVAPAPAKRPEVPTAPASGASVQIGAYSSEALAAKGWADLNSAFPADMSNKGRRTEAVEKDGHTLHRAYVTGFGSKASATAFCAKLKAAGHACLVK